MNISVQARAPSSDQHASLPRVQTSSRAGFKVGMQVLVSGLAGEFTISGLTATSMTLATWRSRRR